jgi:hypothetical protein
MRKDLYPLSIIPRDAAPRPRAARSFPSTTEAMELDHAAPPAHESEGGVPLARRQIASSDSVPGGDAVQG